MGRMLALWMAFFAAVTLATPTGFAQKSGKLSKQDVINLLTGDASSDDVALEARKTGISFQVTPSVINEIKGAGGTESLIQTLQSLAPSSNPAPNPTPPHSSPPASPPTLVIESNPGDAQVYVDDEPVGTTSAQGRLKLSSSMPGNHNVRISLSGYDDYQKTITLTAGGTVTLAAQLQRAAPPPVINPAQHTEEVNPPGSNPGQAGHLGINVSKQPAPGGGVTVATVQAGSPAAMVGIKAGDAILAVDGRPVSSGQELKATLATHPPGETVSITWFDGSTTVTRPVQLTTAPAGGRAQNVNPEPNPNPNPNPIPIPRPTLAVMTFTVAHDHGPNGQGGNNYCVGVMTIGNGMITYRGVRGTNGVHNFQIPLDTVRDAHRNNIYLVAIGAFHIKTKRGTNFNFVAIDQKGAYQSPDAVLNAIDNALGR